MLTVRLAMNTKTLWGQKMEKMWTNEQTVCVRRITTPQQIVDTGSTPTLISRVVKWY